MFVLFVYMVVLLCGMVVLCKVCFCCRFGVGLLVCLHLFDFKQFCLYFMFFFIYCVGRERGDAMLSKLLNVRDVQNIKKAVACD